jgi:hypothetical protein
VLKVMNPCSSENRSFICKIGVQVSRHRLFLRDPADFYRGGYPLPIICQVTRLVQSSVLRQDSDVSSFRLHPKGGNKHPLRNLEIHIHVVVGIPL